MLDIKGELFDMWEVRTITRTEQYNEVTEQQDYYIQLNREGVSTNACNILILCDDENDREETILDIKTRLSEYDSIKII